MERETFPSRGYRRACVWEFAFSIRRIERGALELSKRLLQRDTSTRVLNFHVKINRFRMYRLIICVRKFKSESAVLH